MQGNLTKLNNWLEKAGKVAYHDHDGTMPEHPVAVQDHAAYFSTEKPSFRSKVYQVQEWIRPKGKKSPSGIPIPPSLANVWVPVQKNYPLQIVGTDYKGRIQYKYTGKHGNNREAKKYSKFKKFVKNLPVITKQIAGDLGKYEEADILYAISKTGIRIGSDKDTLAAHKAYGMSTLLGEHISVKGNIVHFMFPAKKGTFVNKTFEDPRLAKIFRGRKKGKGNDDHIFQVEGDDVRKYMKQISGQDFSPKDFRYYIGTSLALQLMKEVLVPTDMKQLKKERARIFKTVSEALGNTPGVAKKSYVAREIFAPWESCSVPMENIRKDAGKWDSLEDVFDSVSYDSDEDFEVEYEEDNDDEEEENLQKQPQVAMVYPNRGLNMYVQKREFAPEEAKQIGDEIGVDWNEIDLEQFQMGVAIELEHGRKDSETNITNDNLEETGKIALAHLKEIPDYYSKLKEMEESIDLEKSKVAYHGPHDGFPEHPVAVKDHQKYFTGKIKSVQSEDRDLESQWPIKVDGAIDKIRVEKVFSEIPMKWQDLIYEDPTPLEIHGREKLKGGSYSGHRININPVLFKYGQAKVESIYPGAMGDNFGDIVLLHEFGHAIFYSLVKHDDLRGEWADASRDYGHWKEQDKLITKYSAINANEFFAECIVYYLRASKILKQIHPTIFAFFDKYLSKQQIEKQEIGVDFEPGLGAWWFETEEGFQQLLEEEKEIKIQKQFEDSTIVALIPSDESKEVLYAEGGQEKDELHLTVVHIPMLVDSEIIRDILRDLPDPPKLGELTGEVEAFDSDQDQNAIVARINIPELEQWRNMLVQALKGRGIEVDDDYLEFKPHITLYYASKEATQFPVFPQERIRFDACGIWMGENKEYFTRIMPEIKPDDMPDPYSEEFYSYIDDTLQKAGLIIQGQQPRGAKSIGKSIEARLYRDLQEAVEDFLNSLTGNETREEVLAGIRVIIEKWEQTSLPAAESAFEALFKRGFTAGAVSAGVLERMGAGDINAMNVLKQGKYRIGERIKLFADEEIKEFQKIVWNSFTPEGVFSLEHLVKEMHDKVPAERFKLERIARTEVASVSSTGRLWAWMQNPEEREYYFYHWNSVPDNRQKAISKLRSSYGNMSFEEIKFLWFHQSQYIPDLKRWENDVFNQRCSISRTPSDEKVTGNRFEGQEYLFRKTMDITF